MYACLGYLSIDITLLFLHHVALLGQIAVVQHFRGSPLCQLTAFSAALMTFWKTVLYGTIEVASGGRNTAQASLFDFVFLYVIPNGLWIIFPGYIICVLGRRFAAQLTAGQPKAKTH